MGSENDGTKSTLAEGLRARLEALRAGVGQLEQLQLEEGQEVVAAMKDTVQLLATDVDELVQHLQARAASPDLAGEQPRPGWERRPEVHARGAAAADVSSLPLVLVADDDKSSRMLIVAVLRRAGYPYLEAGDGEEALGIIKEQQPGILILDGLMPKMDGFEVCTRAKHLDPDYNPKTIIVTAVYKSRSYQYQALAEIGVDEYLTKPLQPGELISRLERLKPGAEQT